MEQNNLESRRRVSEKSRLVTLLLAIFVGVFGVHRFYAGRIASGILYLCTEGLFGIGVIVDIIIIATGSFYDGNGLPIVNWEETPRTVSSGTRQQYANPNYQRAQPSQQPQHTYTTQQPTPRISGQPIYCSECGSVNDDETDYCATCGMPLKK